MDILKYIKALSDETRLRLLHILLHHEMKVGELVSVLEMGQSRVSRHLKILVEAGLLDSWKEGAWGLYYIAESGPGRQFIDAIRPFFDQTPLLERDLERATRTVAARPRSNPGFFDTIANRWDHLKQEILGEFDLNQAIFKDLGTHAVAVDLGCGTGHLLENLKAHAQTVIGVDSAPRMLAQARKRFAAGPAGIEVRLGEIEHLPLGDREADLAVMSLVLQYLAAPEAAIAEVARVLRPGGIFLIAEFEAHHNQALREKFGARWLGFSSQMIDGWLNDHHFNSNQVDRYSLEQGLTLVIYQYQRSDT